MIIFKLIQYQMTIIYLILQSQQMKIAVFLALIACTLQLHSNTHTVAIIATNDFHGVALPSILLNTATNETYKYGGIQYLAQMIETLKHQYKGNVLYLDAGDQFKGGLESSVLVSHGKIVSDFFNVLNVDASAIGNHQFDFGPTFLFDYWKGRTNLLNLAANLESEKGEPNFLPHQQPSKMYELSSGIKIGVIGLITTETSIRRNLKGKFPTYRFLNYTPFVIEESKKLKQRGADAIVLLCHLGNNCTTNQTYGIWTEKTPQPIQCSESDQISQLVKTLPPGIVDGIVQGHRHKFAHNFIDGIPIMGTIDGGYYFNVLYLKFNKKQIVQKTIEGPIPVCQKIFKNIRRCNALKKEEIQTAGPLVEWKFHGRYVHAHEQLQKLYNEKWMPLMQKYLRPIAINYAYLEPNFDKQNDLGNLITNLMNSACPGNDFVVMSSVKFRESWFPGIIDYSRVYRMFPTQYTLVSFEVTGQQLLKTLEILQSGKKAFYPTFGLRQNVAIGSTNNKRLISATFSNGSEINPTQIYRGLTTSNLLSGSNDFKNVVGKVFAIRNTQDCGSFKQNIARELGKLKEIHENVLVDLQHLRLEISYE